MTHTRKSTRPYSSRLHPGKSKLKKVRFSKLRLVIFVLAFGSIGGYLILHSHAASSIPQPDHVVVVIEENNAFDQIIGSPSAPYINSLAQQGANFTNSFAIEHPSQPNYLDLLSGGNQGVTDDSCPHTLSANNLAAELIAANLTFGGYSEDLPSVGSTVCTSGNYARKHNPWVNFTNIPSADNMPFTSFPTDFDNLPTVSFVDPNLCNDMHDCSVSTGDSWLQNNIDAYKQWAMTHNSLLIITFDEDDRVGTNQIATIFDGQMVAAGQYPETIDHFSVLRTLEDMYGLSPHAGAAATATPITDVWNTVSNPPVVGDLNNDGHVSVIDLSIFLSHWQLSGAGLPEDFNNDGVVAIVDLSILLSHYGT